MIAERILGLDELTLEEKALLASELWDAVENGYPSFIPDPSILEELDRRAAHFLAQPETAVSWEEMKARLSKS